LNIGKLWGIGIRFHPAFLLVMAVYAVLGLTVQAFLIVLLVGLHELAHLFTARAFGFQIKGLELFPFGGAAYCEDSFEGRKLEESAMALAGPLLNVVLLAGMEILRFQGWVTGDWSAEFVRLNFWLAAFNLFPVLPLDGGRVVRALLSNRFGFVRTTKFLARAGQWWGLLLAVAGFTLWGKDWGLMANLLLLGAFFWIAGGKEVEAARITFLRGLARKKEELVKKGWLPNKTLTVCPEIPLIRVVEQFVPDCYTLVAVTGDKFELNKILTETEVVEGMITRGIHCPVGRLL